MTLQNDVVGDDIVDDSEKICAVCLEGFTRTQWRDRHSYMDDDVHEHHCPESECVDYRNRQTKQLENTG